MWKCLRVVTGEMVGERGKVRRDKYFGAGVVTNMKSFGFDVGLVINGNRFFKEQSLRNETDRQIQSLLHKGSFIASVFSSRF